MSEILEGLVTAVEGDYAKVRPKRHSECDDCQACLSADLIVLAYNPKKASVGQTVHYQEAQQGILLIAWVLFLQPLTAVFLGLWLGSLGAAALGWPAAVGMTVGAALLFALAVVFVLGFDRRYKRKQNNFARIIAVLS